MPVYEHFHWIQLSKDASTSPCDLKAMLSLQMISLQHGTHRSVYWGTWHYPCGIWKSINDDNGKFLVLEFSAGHGLPWKKHVFKLNDENDYVLLQKKEAEKIYDDPTLFHQSSTMHWNEQTIAMRKVDSKITQSEGCEIIDRRRNNPNRKRAATSQRASDHC